MTFHDFLITWLGVGWEPGTPLSRIFKPAFWGLTLIHWFSLIFTVIVIRSLEYAIFFLYPWCYFSGRLPLPFFLSSKELLLSSPFSSKYVMRVARFLAHRPPVWLPWLLSHLSDSRTDPWILVLRFLASAELLLYWTSLSCLIISRTIWSEWFDQGDPLACCRMSIECLVGTHKFRTTLVTLSLQLWI